MKISSVSLLAVLLLISLTFVTLPIRIPDANAQDFSRIVARTRSAVALVFVEQNDGNFASGTGFAITGSPILVTAAHLVTDVKDVIVRYADGTVSPARPILVWQERDIALIQPRKALSPGLSGRTSPPRVGEPVIVIGYPLADKLGYSQVSVTQGIISAIHSDVIQLSVPVNPGNSGGPVLDATGAVLGVVGGTLPGTGLAFASAWSNVKTLLDAFAKDSYPVAISLVNSDKSVTGWIEQGTVLVDANLLANLLGGIVFWDPNTKTLTLAIGGKRLRFVQGSRTMDVDGQQVILPLPMTADRKIPLKPVLAILGGSVEVNLSSFVARVSLPGAQSQANPPQPETPQATPPKTQPETPQATPPKPSVDPGPREVRAGFGSTTLAFGIDGAEVAKLLGAPDARQIFQPIPGLTYRPVALVYKNFGIIVLLAEGRLWGIGVLTRDWVLQPSGLRVGDSAEGMRSAFGFAYVTESSGEFTIFWYKGDGIGFWVKDGRINSFLTFQATVPSTASPRTLGVSGNWSGYWSSSRVPGNGVFVVNLSQNGSFLSGTAALNGSPCFGPLQISGTISGDSFSFTAFTDGVARVLVSGSILGDTMTGSYTALTTGTPCDGDRGTFSANRRTPSQPQVTPAPIPTPVSPTPQPTPPPSAVTRRPVFDNLIVPGERVSGIALGMTLNEASAVAINTFGGIATIAEDCTTQSERNRGFYCHVRGWRGEADRLAAWIILIGPPGEETVSLITTSLSSHKTKEGLGPGAALVDFVKVYGEPIKGSRIQAKRSFAFARDGSPAAYWPAAHIGVFYDAPSGRVWNVAVFD